jgi:tripartite-type tricarboxylate transporter receptor subunit TctC
VGHGRRLIVAPGAHSGSLSAGRDPDVVGRTHSSKLQEAFGQAVVVENRTGAGANIGTEVVAKAPADGYTLVISTQWTDRDQ